MNFELNPRPHISVCICTFRRLAWLRRLLLALEKQKTNDLFCYSVVVADNDPGESAKDVCSEFSGRINLTYCVEPEKNIALVRNRSIVAATGDWIAFIDDDEFPIEDWLLRLFEACLQHDAQGVLGPVRPHFEETPPSWVRKCGLYERPEHKTGFVMEWRECRTGNVLFQRKILREGELPFAAEFPNGGEDQDFFRRMMMTGHRFIWCNEAIVFETVPPIRWNKKVMIQRALLRGKNTLKHAGVRPLDLMKSTVAVVAYTVALPVLAVLGMHLFMCYLVKLCDHLGKLLAVFGINPIQNRVG